MSIIGGALALVIILNGVALMCDGTGPPKRKR